VGKVEGLVVLRVRLASALHGVEDLSGGSIANRVHHQHQVLPRELHGLVELLGGLVSPVILARTITPMFLHFGELHLIFNMLWLWYFGRQLEPLRPAWIYPAVVLLTSFVANTAQYLLGGGSNFGGMSGVVYGLVGYAWILHRFSPRSGLLLNDQMFLFFVIMLVAMEVFASSWIATAAHLGGLLAGLFLGIVFAVFRRT